MEKASLFSEELEISDDVDVLEQFRNDWQAEVQEKHSGKSSLNSIQASPQRVTSSSQPVKASTMTPPLLAQTSPQRNQTSPQRNEALATHPLKPISMSPLRELTEQLSLTKMNQNDAAPMSDFDEAMKMYREAEYLERNGHLDTALRLYRRALKLAPDLETAMRETSTVQVNATSSTKPKESVQKEEIRMPEVELNWSSEEMQYKLSRTLPYSVHIQQIPNEIMFSIFIYAATGTARMAATFEKLALVCRFWYKLARDSHLWRQLLLIHLRPEDWYGIALKRSITFRLLLQDIIHEPLISLSPSLDDYRLAYIHSAVRIRFDGLYVSCHRYIRPGQTESHYHQPIHVVTYYRYLRFYQNGIVLAWCTTEEPGEVVKLLHLSMDIVALPKEAPGLLQVAKPCNQLMRGHFHLSAQGHVTICVSVLYPNTGASKKPTLPPTTTYHKRLQLKNEGFQSKLVWLDYRMQTETEQDPVPYPMRTLRPYIFSKVKRY